MRRVRCIAIGVAVLVASAATSRPAAAEFEGPLEIAAYGWLELLDAGRFDDAWREGADRAMLRTSCDRTTFKP